MKIYSVFIFAILVVFMAACSEDESQSVVTSPSPSLSVDESAPAFSNFAINNGGNAISKIITLDIDATDDVGVSAYFASESSTPPLASDAGWVSITSSTSISMHPTFELTSGGLESKTVNLWLKDSAENISTMASATAQYVIADGELDISFDFDGILTANNYPDVDQFTGVAIAPDDSLWLAYDANASAERAGVMRLKNDGALDPDFNLGSNLFWYGASSGYSAKCLLDSQGRFLMTGVQWDATPMHDMSVWRVLPTGVFDSSFDGDGAVRFDQGAGVTPNIKDEGVDLKLDQNGKIVVLGYSENSSIKTNVIYRYNTDGSLDFKFTHLFPGGNNLPYSLAIDANGNYVIAGWLEGDIYVARFSPAGALDNSFNDSNGFYTYDSGGNNDVAYSVIVDAEGRLLIGAYSAHFDGIEVTSNMLVIRLNANGTVDTTFGSNGLFTDPNFFNAPSSHYQNLAAKLVLDPAGNIIAAGEVYDGSRQQPTIWRILPDGSLDTSFNSGAGSITIPENTDNLATFWDVAIDSKGRIVAVGILNRWVSTSTAIVARIR